MLSPNPRSFPLLVACLIFGAASLTGCMDGRPYGWIKDEHGDWVRNSPENIQRADAAHLERELRDTMPTFGPYRVVFSQPPEYFSEYDDESPVEGESGWKYPSMAITVVYAGEPGTSSDEAQMQSIVKDGIEYKMQFPSDRTYEINHRPNAVVAGAAPAAPATASASSTPPEPTASDAGPAAVPEGTISYTIQTGDTMAGIAKIHYGDASKWQLIVRANPGLDPFQLEVGATVLIPPPGQ